MADVTTLFWDVGGVILTNGWDRMSRRRAAELFALDWEEFEARHQRVVAGFETGRVSLGDYLDETVFYRLRTFAPEEFKEFIFAQSQPYPEVLAVLERLARADRYILATLNNESPELNRYRIRRFGLRTYFAAFLSSGVLGVQKPDEAIYRLALALTQRDPEECLFIDDRRENLETGQRLGMRTVHYQNPEQLKQALEDAGVGVFDAPHS